MTEQDISFIIPVFNRPDEIEELLGSFSELESEKSFEIVIVEDGSTVPCKSVIEKHSRMNMILRFTETRRNTNKQIDSKNPIDLQCSANKSDRTKTLSYGCISLPEL